MLRAIHRALVVCIATVAGMAGLGVAASACAAVREAGWYLRWDWQLALIAAAVGACVGFVAMPFVAGALVEADLRKSLPRIFVIALLLTCVWVFLIPLGYGITAAAPAFVSVIVLAAWCGGRFSLEPRPGLCEQCQYDLSGCAEPGCPECGWGRGEPPL